MSRTTGQVYYAQLKKEIGDPKTTPRTFAKRCETLLTFFNSRRSQAFVNKQVLARLLSDDPDVRDAAEQFRVKLENAQIENFKLRKRKLIATERQKLGIDPVPVPPADGASVPPVGAIGKAPGSDGHKYWVDAEGRNLGRAD
jgi:hypothetical protein